MVLVLFFLSGVAALLYQVVWTKQLALQFGVTAYAVSTTVSVFMLGLAVGAWVFGRRADRVPRPLATYARLELGIAAGAMASLALLRGIDALLGAAWMPETSGAVFVGLRTVGTVVVLGLPTLLMGGTLPMLAKHVVWTRGDAGRGVGRLYAVNALGGAVGALLAGFVTLGALGLRGSILVGVAINVLAAVAAAALSRRPARVPPAPVVPVAPPAAVAPAAPVPRALHAAFFVAGLVGLAVEVVWTRMLLLNLDATAPSFAAMLAVCLVGLALGSWATSRLADRVAPVGGYAISLALVGGAILAFAAVWATSDRHGADVARWCVDRLPAVLRVDVAFRLASALFECAQLLLVPTFLMGCSFPFAGRAFSARAPEVGRRLGSALSMNTLGATIGPLLCGFWWLPTFGIQASLVVCGTLALAAGAWLLATSAAGWRRGAVVGLAGALVAVAWRAPADVLVANTAQRRGGTILSAEEDVNGSVVVLDVDAGFERCRQLKVGTTSMIADNFACRRYTRLLGHLPMLLHPAPRDAMVICLGSGMTLSAAAAHPDVATIDCVELSPAVVRAARTHFAGPNGHVLEDARVRVIVNDGRTQLRASRKAYDVIALEPPPPFNDGVAALYSREFYALCRARLRPGGMVCQWIPYHGALLGQIRSLLATMRAEFPHTTLWELFDGREYCVIGRLDETPIPFERVAERLAVRRVATHLEPVGIRRPEDLFACFVLGTQGLDAFVGDARPVTDDLPGIGYDLAAEARLTVWRPDGQRAIQTASLATAAHAEDPARYLAFATPEAHDGFVARLRPAKAAWGMHALALRLGTLDPAAHRDVFTARFVAPTTLDRTNPYYQYAERRGVYRAARARQRELVVEGGG